MSKALSDIEIGQIMDLGYNKKIIDGWFAANWSRQDILDLLEDEWKPDNSVTNSKKGKSHCLICNDIIWDSRMNAHIFKAHMNELLRPFNQSHLKNASIQQVTVPLEITCPIFYKEDDKPTNKIIVREDQCDSELNPKTNRMKKIARSRPEPVVLPPQLYYCLVCSKAWSSEKSARKHFIGTKGLSDCVGSKQLIKINQARGTVVPNYAAYAQVSVRVPDVSLNDDLNKEISILELRDFLNKFKDENKRLNEQVQLYHKKIKQFADIGIKKDEAIRILTEKLEFAEGEAEVWKGKYEYDIIKPIKLNPHVADY
jgi:hypothetical protein